MKSESRTFPKLAALNRKLAKSRWGDLLTKAHLSMLGELSRQFKLSIAMGDLMLLDGRWYVTHSGLLRLARNRRCAGIQVRPLANFSDASCRRWAFEATVFKSRGCRGFVGHGDADPSNVSALVHGAEMRVAETRAVNRAIRQAYAIGICSVEEIGSSAERSQDSAEFRKLPPQPANGNGGERTVRDRLCQVIRQHHLDPNLVKSYAIDFCAVKTLKEATRDQVVNFVVHLSNWAEKDRNALLCQLNSFLGQKEGAA